MMKKIIVLIFCFSAAAVSVETGFFILKGIEGFGKPARTDGVGIHSKGYLTLVPKAETLFSPPEEIVWSLVKSGNVIYAGVGETGNILYIREDGETGVMSKLGKLCVKALAADGKGNVYAGGPDGIIYLFPDIINQSPFFRTGEKYIWSMIFDAHGVCYAGTGPEGRVYRINPDGTGELLYDGEEKHILSLAADEKNVYAGTGGEGLIYRIDLQSRKGTVLARLPGREITDICIKERDLYAVSNPGKPLKGSGVSKPKAAPAKSGPGSSGSKKKAACGLFKVSTDDGDTDLFFKPPAGNISSAALLEDGRIAVGTDKQGTVYLIEDKENWIEFSIENVGAVRDIFPLARGFLAGTGKKGFITRFSTMNMTEGEYVSKKYGIAEVERWGILESEIDPEGTSVRYFFRTGRVESSDENWTDWKEIADGDLSSLETGKPFFQMKLAIRNAETAGPPVVRRIQFSFRPVNRKPEIKIFQIVKKGNSRGNKGQNSQPPSGGSDSGIPVRQDSIQLKWNCSDPNGDPLSYTICRKLKGGGRWIVEQENIKKNKTMLGTGFIPDGKYRIKLIASDEQANINGRGFSVEKELDECIIVDRTSPAVSVLAAQLSEKTFTVKCRAEDALSPLRRCFYRVNEKEWKPVPAEDMLFDELEEECEFSIDRNDVSPGDIVIVRFDDDAMNYQLVRIEVKP